MRTTRPEIELADALSSVRPLPSWLDGVYSWQPGRGEVAWHEHEGLTDADVAAQVRRIGARVTRELKKAGKWWDEGDAADASEVVDGEQQTMLTLASGAVTGRAALGERAGQIDVRVGRGTRAEPFVKGPLCADHDGFSLHAGVRVAAGDRKRLEHLLRYAGRAAIAESRLSLLPDGRVAYSLKRRWKDGSTHVVMEPEVLIERLLALVPPPRRHLVTYHSVLAPAAGLRSRVVPRVDEVEAVADEGVDAVPEQRAVQAVLALCLRRRTVPHAPNGGRSGCATMRRRRYPWAELLRRVFAIDVLVCPHCGGVRRLLAAITAPDAIEKVLRAIGLPCEVAQVAPARAPPGGPEWWGA
ncbi:MAG: transposase [Planctomycetes bacterium]|nr:transposase [Planctomycetota bacterium]